MDGMSHGPKAGDFDAGWQAWSMPADMQAHMDRHVRQRAVLLAELERALAGPASPASLEVGCGTGFDSCVLALRHPGLAAIGIDFSDRALAAATAIAQRLGAKADFRKADMMALPFGDAAFDLVFSQGVMEHFPDPTVPMLEQVRVLRPGGTLVIDVPQTFNVYTLIKHTRRAQGKWPWGWERQYTPWGLARMGRRAGLVPVRFAGYGAWGGRVDALALLHRLGPRVVWDALDRRLGRWYLMNLVGVFRKPT
jgi:SAM-dependent methyltransferase